jgi:hypothetical protein
MVIMKNGYAIPNTIGGVKLVNEILKLSKDVWWASNDFKSGNHKFKAGTFLVQEFNIGILEQLLEKYPVEVYKLPSGVEVNGYSIRMPKIALYNGQGIDGINARFRADAEYALNLMGFLYALVDENAFREEVLSQFDVLLIPVGDASEILNGWNTKLGWNKEPWQLPGSTGGIGKKGVATIKRFIENGGTYIGISSGGAALACKEVGNIADVKMRKFEMETEKFIYATGQTRLHLKIVDFHPVVFGYEEIFPAYYVSDPLTLTYGGPIFEAGENVKTIAVYRDVDSEDWTGLFSNPKPFTMDYPAIVEQLIGKGCVILFGIDTFYGATWISTYRLISNSLFLAKASH